MQNIKFSSYKKRMPESMNNVDFLNISAYPEFLEFCEDNGLTIREARILEYILRNAKEWEISPTCIAKDFFNTNEPTDSQRKTISRDFSNLLKKLEKYIKIIKRSSATFGSIIDASEVYNYIYNEVVKNRTIKVYKSEEPSAEDESVQLEKEETGIDEEIEEQLSNLPESKRDLFDRRNKAGYFRTKEEMVSWITKNSIIRKII